MPSRFTITEKWQDVWFRKLSYEEKILFMYLCDNCDCAGFIEIDFERWSFETRIPLDDAGTFNEIKPIVTLNKAFEGLQKTYFSDGKFIWLKNFIFYQGNLPLLPDWNPHKGIIVRLNSHNSLGSKALDYLDSQIKEKKIGSLGKPSMKASSKGLSYSKGNKGVQGENLENQICLVDKERAYGNAFTVRSKNGKNLMFNLCPACKKIYCELVKSEKIHTGKTSLSEIESLIQKQKAVR